MLTRAYDTIMAAIQVPVITNQNVDFNNSAIDDSVLNCRNYGGSVKTLCSTSVYTGSGWSAYSLNSGYIPLLYWNTQDYNCLLPDEVQAEPSYEDYSVPNRNPSGWTVSSSYPLFSKSYDPDTKEIVCSVTVLWQNTSGVEKTVYGVNVRGGWYYRQSYNSTAFNFDNFLLCREHFASPVVVEDQGIIALTFTWRVGRAGLVSATAAAAE